MDHKPNVWLLLSVRDHLVIVWQKRKVGKGRGRSAERREADNKSREKPEERGIKQNQGGKTVLE